MKWKFSLLFVFMLMGFTTLQAAFDFTASGLHYTITDIGTKTVKVTDMYYYNPVDPNVVIPSKVTNPGDAIEYTVTALNSSCFAYSFIKSVFIPNTVSTIETQAFRECKDLEAVTFEAGNNITCIYNATFAYCNKLKDIVLPDNITVIENYAFLSSALLETVTLPNKVITINSTAFMDLPSFNKLICLSSTPPILPDPGGVFYLTAIGTDTLSVPPGAKTNYASIYPWNAFKEIKAEPLWKDVGNFGDLNFVITDGISKTVKLANLQNYAPIDGNIIIPSKVINNVDGLEYTVTGIDKNCFEYSKLTSVFIPNTITKIDTLAFRECKDLVTVTFESGNNMTRIYKGAFQYCHKLENIVLPDNISVIEDWVFLDCIVLKSITLPSQITDIMGHALRDCPALKEVICPATLPPTMGGYVVSGTPIENAVLRVSAGAKTNYQSIYPWSAFKSINETLILNANSNLSALIDCATCDIIVNSGNELTVDESATYSSLIIASGGKVTNNNVGNTTLTLSGTLTIESNAIKGTGTYVEKQNGLLSVAGTTTVMQYLASARNWYVASPVSNALAPANFTYYKYLEAGNNPADPIVAPATAYWASVGSGSLLSPTVGYIALPTAKSTISLTTEAGGSLNTGNQTTQLLTRTALASTPGFNLVGNPYPSYLNINSFNNSSVIIPTVWMRSKNSTWGFDTYNIPSGLSVGTSGYSVSNLIPPLQAFWVRLKSNVSSGTLTFGNDMREHIDHVNNKFRAPKVSAADQKVIRLQVSNGTYNDEAIVYFNENAADNFDQYDSPKMNNLIPNIPEIYTVVENEQLAINGLKNLSTSNAVAVGFKTAESNIFSIKTSEIKNFESDTRIILIDKVLSQEIDLTDGTVHTFNSSAVNTASRFSLVFRSPKITTGLATQSFTMSIFKNANNQLTITTNSDARGNVSIYNVMGQRVGTYLTMGNSTLIDTALSAGVYAVTLEIAGVKRTEKIILN